MCPKCIARPACSHLKRCALSACICDVKARSTLYTWKAMQALSSSALGSPLEAQATGDAADRERNNLAELRRAAMANLHASQRHQMGVLPGMISSCSSTSVLVCDDLPPFDSPQMQLISSLTASVSCNVNVLACRSNGNPAVSYSRFAQDRSVYEKAHRSAGTEYGGYGPRAVSDKDTASNGQVCWMHSAKMCF